MMRPMLLTLFDLVGIPQHGCEKSRKNERFIYNIVEALHTCAIAGALLCVLIGSSLSKGNC